jgi:hypothetical protein
MRRTPARAVGVPSFRTVVHVQRTKMVVDVASADLEVAERLAGTLDPTVGHFRQALSKAQQAWEHLRADLGAPVIEAALAEPPRAYLTLGGGRTGQPRTLLIPISGQTYQAEHIMGTPLAPVQWRLTLLGRSPGVDPYYVCRLRDGSTQCDCADWIFRAEGIDPPGRCKHLIALDALGWLEGSGAAFPQLKNRTA